LQGGWLFGGAYHYHPAVRPVLPGGVPLFIPLAWFVLCGLPLMLLRSLKTWRPDGTRDVPRLVFKSALAAWGVMACDLALDPIAVSLGLWTWESPGAYFGIPGLNFLGWWVVAFGVFLAGCGWAGFGDRPAPPVPIRYDLGWGVAHGLLLILLALCASNRLGEGMPVAFAVAAISPLSLRWVAEVYWKIKVRRRRGGTCGSA
jgi:uncharacterized membrane protein